jgi:hypothetical protein
MYQIISETDPEEGFQILQVILVVPGTSPLDLSDIIWYICEIDLSY